MMSGLSLCWVARGLLLCQTLHDNPGADVAGVFGREATAGVPFLKTSFGQWLTLSVVYLERVCFQYYVASVLVAERNENVERSGTVANAVVGRGNSLQGNGGVVMNQGDAPSVFGQQVVVTLVELVDGQFLNHLSCGCDGRVHLYL